MDHLDKLCYIMLACGVLHYVKYCHGTARGAPPTEAQILDPVRFHQMSMLFRPVYM